MKYANIFRKSHITLIELLNVELKSKKVTTVGYGDRTQHIFVDNKYWMTVNWNLV